MAESTGPSNQARMDRVARLTLALGGFMLVLLIAFPFTLGNAAMSGTAPYLLYSLFLREPRCNRRTRWP